ncbi:MAG: IPT/TIG domain-containing protein [Verrucomicrobiota bacterium]
MFGVGTTPNGVDLFAGHVNPTNGFRRVPMLGNSGSRLSLTLNGIPNGVPIYWGVQAVDTAFAGGPLATNVFFPPSISAVNPPTGPTAGGIPILLIGTNFTTNATVTIGGKSASVTAGIDPNTQIFCTLPAGQGTNVPVIVTSGGVASAAANFTYDLPAVTNVSPAIGPTPGGITVTLEGNNFGTSGT